MRRFLDVGAELRDAYDAALESERQTSSPIAIVSDMGHALEIVRRSDFVTLTLLGFADALARSDLRVLTPPHPTPAIEIGAIYHPDQLRDPGFVRLLNLLASA
jgi:DNA-binding transcriptional LysR family regulator